MADLVSAKTDWWSKPCRLSPSLICLDLCNLERDVSVLEEAGIGQIHVDILDGHFSPSMPLGLDAVRQLRAKTDLPFECHVMTTANDYFVDELLDIGVQQIVVHAETEPHIDGMLKRIHAHGVRAGLALKPATDLSILSYVLDMCDSVLLMLINPGYAFMRGEAQVGYAERKILDLRQMITERGLKTEIAIDGRIAQADIRRYGAGTVDSFVVGSTCLRRGELRESLADLQALRKKIIEESK
ncbi:MAG: ribulose-phosphate 3-epimerase [Eubacteriales bacterium]|nr:ribulose-phosphate 3-epimerase [Clostridiales bacterium]MDY5836957.1 ribulose-phosphate 3-epimerase [Eubacteriales bacterium]